RTHTLAAHPFETGHDRTGNNFHAGARADRSVGAHPVQPFYGGNGPRLAAGGCHLSIHETHHLLATNLSRSRFLLWRAYGLASYMRTPRLASDGVVRRIHLRGDRI